MIALNEKKSTDDNIVAEVEAGRVDEVRRGTRSAPPDDDLAIDAESAVGLFGDVADAAIRSATNDTSHRWRESRPGSATT